MPTEPVFPQAPHLLKCSHRFYIAQYQAHLTVWAAHPVPCLVDLIKFCFNPLPVIGAGLSQ